MLNPPDKILKNLNDAPERMRVVDRWLGPEVASRFAAALSSLLRHIEPETGGLVDLFADKSVQAEFVIQIVNCATELEAAWNSIRLSNIAAARRNLRVALELIAVAVLMCLPLDQIRKLPSKLTLVKYLQHHPDATVSSAYSVVVEFEDGIPIAKVPIQATEFFTAFVAAGQEILAIPSELMDGLKSYRKNVLHPASHGSADLLAYHFKGFESTNWHAGAVLDPSRRDSLIETAIEVAGVAEILVKFLDIAKTRLPSIQSVE